MKNFTNNFKQFTSRLSARWLIMALMLLVGTSGVWAAATQRYIYVGISNNYYQYKTNNEYGFNFWGGTSGGVKSGTYIATHTHDGRKYYMYRVQIHDDNNKAQFKGNNNWWDPGEGYSVTLNGTTNNAIFFSHSNDGWQGQFQNNYQETSTASLAASATSVNTNTNVTLTPSLSTNATYNQIKSTSYSISPSSGASISNNTFKATAAGTYTVTATVTYNPKYFTGITKTATATKTITVKESCITATLSWASTFDGSMKVGDEVTNPASLDKAAAASSISYTSSNPDVISVNGTKLTALKSGKATITASATANDGYCVIESLEKEVTVTCDVVNTEDITIEVVCTSGDTPYIWAWEPDNGNNNLTGGEWPGQAMTPEGNNVYKWETKPTSGESVSIIISKNENGANQTNDIGGLQIGKRYKFSYDPNTKVSGSNDRYVYQLLEEDCLDPACTPPTITLSNNTVTYNGNPQKPTITIEGGATPTTVKYDGTEYTNGPTNAGIYTVTVWADAKGDYCELEGDEATSSFTINQKAPESTDFTYTASKTYTGNALSAGVAWKTGTGSGQITTYYKVQGADDNTYSNTAPTNAGTYTVAVTTAAAGNYGAVTKLEIGDFTIDKKTVTNEQYPMSPTTFTYNGERQVPTITPASGAGTVISTAYELNNTTAVTDPIDAGTYTVYVTSNAGTNYTAASSLYIGSFTIEQKGPTINDFTYTESKDYTGSSLSADVAWQDGTGTGAITTYYKVKGAADNTYTTTAPTEVGTYTVAVTTTAGGNYKAITEKIELGTFTINEVCEDPSNIVFTINSPQSNYYLGDKVDATLNYDGTEVDKGHTWSSSNVGILGPAPKKGSKFTFTLKKVGDASATIYLPKCTSGTVPSNKLEFDVKALPAPTNAEASVTGNTANLSWTPGVRDSVLIVRYAKDATITAPKANTKYIVGNEIGDGMVVYKGTDTSFSNSGLTYGNAYEYYFYTVNNNYYSTANNPKATVSVCPTAITGADNLFVNKTSEYTINATTEATYSWSIDTETDASIAYSGNTATVTAGATAGNATISVTISSGNCNGTTLTKDITIKDGIVIYIRRPKSGDGTSVYSNWYNESSVKGGLPWVKAGSISGSGKDDNKATTNNTGGTELTEAFTDCDGYTWDSFTPADSWSSFYLHALNDYKQDGWATFSKAISFDKTTDNYFYLSSWNSGEYGVTITKTVAPALGITIDALGSTEVISNNMASFAALYLKGNCSGKELKTDSKGDFTDQTFLWQYSTDGTPWSTYTGGDGATWNNIRPTQEGKYRLICTMEDDSQIESNIITISTTTENYDADDLINITSNLPIFMVNTGGKGFPSCVNDSDFPTKHADALKKKRSVDVKIKVGNDIVYDRKARMNYRGSSSLNFKKKSYAFSSGQEYCGLDKDESPDYMKKGKMDMFSVITNGAKTSSEEKDWVLYAANPDPSMMRNILAIDTYKAMTGEWGVQNQYVELYIDGVYQGVYVFLDKITQGKKRINVKWDVDDASKRGFILKFDKTDVADRYEDATGDQKTFESDLTGASGIGTYGAQVDQRFEIEYPEKGDIEDDGGSWAEVKGFIETKVNAFESALKDGKFNEVRNMIDYQSWADFFIINEFVKNVDAYRASCIFVYEDNKLKAYPLWDYELSFNNQAIGSGKGKADPTGLLIEHDDVYSDDFAAPFWWTGRYSNHIYKGLLDDPCFVSMIKTRWDMHANGEGALTQSKLQDLVDSYTTALTTTDATTNKVGEVTLNTPQLREAQKWPYTYNYRGKADCNSGNTGYYDGWTSDKCEADMTALTNWIATGNAGRRDNLDGIIEEMASDISFSLSVVSDKSTTTPWRPVIITVSSNSGYEYTITPEAAQVKDNGNQHTIYLARPEGYVGKNFATQTEAYTFTATSGETDQCGSSEPVSQSVMITLEDIVENCP